MAKRGDSRPDANNGMTRREEFERDLAVVEACRASIDAIAYQLNPRTATPREISHQMIANTTIVTQVAALMDKYDMTVAYTDDKAIAAIPHPIKINHRQTMLNFDNHR